MELITAILSFLLHVWPLIVLLALALLPTRPLARIVAFAGGLIFCVGGVFLSPASGPDNPLLIVPLFGLPLSLAAAFAEGVLRLSRFAKRWRVEREEAGHG
jgi:hypothetical protein